MDVLRGLKFMKDNPNIQSDFKSGIIYYMFVTNALLQYFRLSLYCIVQVALELNPQSIIL